MPVQPIPEDFHTVTPFLLVPDAGQLMDFLAEAFDAEEHRRMTTSDGTVMHGSVKIGDSMIMMGQAREEDPPMITMIYLYVDDVDAVYGQAIEAGAEPVREPLDEFYGDRTGGVKGPFGNLWWISTHVEDLSDEEIQRRMREHGDQG